MFIVLAPSLVKKAISLLGHSRQKNLRNKKRMTQQRNEKKLNRFLFSTFNFISR
jgi:hypothetical protein